MRLGGECGAVAERAVVRLQSVAKRYGDGPEILRDVSFALAPGSFHFVTGASGAGKTTLLNIIALAEPPSRGTVTLFDTEAGRASRAVRAQLRRRIGTVFQDCRLADELSVAENVALPLRIDGVPDKARRDNVAALLDWLGIADRSAARPSTLSAGDRQRVALARAIVRRPDLLLADEPVGAGGDDLALLLVGAYERMTQLGTIVLVATRDTGFAERFAHPRLHLDGGTLSPSGAAS
jgi:cell division transport system ATP-binding protein